MDGLLRSCHDVADGGIATALAESSILGGQGVDISLTDLKKPLSDGCEPAAMLFGEGQSRFLISVDTEAAMPLHELADRHRVPLEVLGTTGGDRIRIDGALDVTLEQAREAYETALV